MVNAALIQAYEQLQAALNLGKPPRRASSHSSNAHTQPPKPHHLSEAHVRSEFGKIAAQPVADAAPGHIASSQLGQLLRNLGISLSEEQLAESQVQLDPESAGVIAEDDLVAWIQG